MKKIIAVGLSGGVDSATSAYLLKQEGHEVIGLTMWVHDDQVQELDKAKKIAHFLGIDHHILDYRKAFEKSVIQPMIRAYEAGETPNPCLLCNRALKYNQLIKDGLALGASHFSTGHYVDLQAYHHHLLIKRSINPKKDQSYFLYEVDPSYYDRLLFPMRNFSSKDEVRRVLQDKLPFIAQKKDSQGICFLPGESLGHFLKRRGSSAMKSGSLLAEGKIIGQHYGLALYTIGQKKGLKNEIPPGYAVSSMDGPSGQISLSKEEDLMIHELTLPRVTLHLPLQEKTKVYFKTSQWSPYYQGFFLPEAKKLVSEEAFRKPAPGQAIVLYLDDYLIGGGLYSSN